MCIYLCMGVIYIERERERERGSVCVCGCLCVNNVCVRAVRERKEGERECMCVWVSVCVFEQLEREGGERECA